MALLDALAHPQPLSLPIIGMACLMMALAWALTILAQKGKKMLV
jgi:hypothetical protein